MLTRWYRTGVIYSVDVGLFQDGNDDGIGDFQGLAGRPAWSRARHDHIPRLAKCAGSLSQRKKRGPGATVPWR